MGVCLMSHIPDDLIQGGIKNLMHCDGQLNHSETGGKMTAIGSASCNDDFAQVSGKNLQIIDRQLPEVIGTVNGIKNACHQDFRLTIYAAISRRGSALSSNPASASSATST